MNVIDEIAAERKRQIEVEGWSPEHDDEHCKGEMAEAASAYAFFADLSPSEKAEIQPATWPWDMQWWKPKSQRHDLIRAAALIVAEIERLDREKEQK